MDFSKTCVKGKAHKSLLQLTKKKWKGSFVFFPKTEDIKGLSKPNYFQHANSLIKDNYKAHKDQNQSQFSKRKENPKYNHSQNADDHNNYQNYTFKD